MTDYCVMVAEDNDGGHELELGEIPLAETFVLKRDYSDSSIDNDLEHRMFDSMILGVFEFIERNGQLFLWTDDESFAQGVANIILNTT
jgi:hypothetical protein